MKQSHEEAKAMHLWDSDVWTVEKYCKQNLECQIKKIYHLVEEQTWIFFVLLACCLFSNANISFFSNIELNPNKETSFLDILTALPVSIFPPIVSGGDNPWRGALIRYLFMVLQSKALICQGDSRSCCPQVRKKWMRDCLVVTLCS